LVNVGAAEHGDLGGSKNMVSRNVKWTIKAIIVAHIAMNFVILN
jgi:hypothetical protein